MSSWVQLMSLTYGMSSFSFFHEWSNWNSFPKPYLYLSCYIQDFASVRRKITQNGKTHWIVHFVNTACSVIEITIVFTIKMSDVNPTIHFITYKSLKRFPHCWQDYVLTEYKVKTSYWLEQEQKRVQFISDI